MFGPWVRKKLDSLPPSSKLLMLGVDFDSTPSLAADMGLLRCVHGEEFPCCQCRANHRWNEAATGRKLTEAEFEQQYAQQGE